MRNSAKLIVISILIFQYNNFVRITKKVSSDDDVIFAENGLTKIKIILKGEVADFEVKLISKISHWATLI